MRRRRQPRLQGRTTLTELLEARQLFCIQHAGQDFVSDFPAVTAAARTSAAELIADSQAYVAALNGAPSFQTNAMGLPLLTSRSSGLKIFLDFDGYGNDLSFDIDNNPSSFSTLEQADIYQTWRDVVSFYSPFDVSVTTIQPATGGSNPAFVWHRVSKSISGGAAYVGAFNNSSSNGWSDNDTAVNRHSGVAHEIGHQLGLSHQSEYDLYATKTSEYSDGYGDRDRTIMGVDYSQNVRRFFYGRNSDGSNRLADEMQTIANSIKNVVGGDGYRPDDYAATTAAATDIPAGGTIAGIIERSTDADIFRFTSAAGGTYHIDATPTFESAVSPKIELLDSGGNILAARDDADRRTGNNNDQEFDVNLGAGTYYVRVASSGDYDEQGEYLLTAAPLPTGWFSADVGSPVRGGTAAYDPAVATLRQLGAGNDIWGTSDQFRFTGQILNGNGSITARVDQLDDTDPNSKAGVMIRQSLNGNSASVYLGNKPSGQIDPIVRTGSGGVATTVINPAGITGKWVRITRAGNTFTLASSDDGANWVTRVTTNVSMTGAVYVGLATCSHSTRNAAWSTLSNIAFTGSPGTAPIATNPGIPVPTGLTAVPAPGASTSIVLNWTDVAGETGYAIERSVDGVTYSQIASASADVVSYTDAGLFGSMRYFYRIAALNTAVSPQRSDVTPAVSVVNKPSAPAAPPGSYAVPAILPNATESYLNWADVQGDEGYRVERSTDNGSTFTLVANTSKNYNAYNVSNLAANTPYVFRVTPITVIGDGVAPSYLFNVTTRTPAPTGLAFTAKSSNAQSMRWNDIAGETGYRVERSTDGQTWSTAADLAANTTSWTATGLSPVSEYYYRVLGLNGTLQGLRSGAIFAATPPASPNLPASYWNNADVGAVGGSGTSSYSNGTWTLLGAGADIWNSADEFQFASRPLQGDGSIVARVASLENTDTNAKAGVMIRESSAAGSRYAFMFITPTNGVWNQFRSGAGAGASSAGNTGGAAPVWVKLTRVGNTFTGYYSADGTAWTQLGTSQSISMGSTVLIGLALTSHDDTELNRATFDNVNVVGAVPDNTPPAAPLFAGISEDTGVSPTDQVTSDDTLVLRGTAEANSSITITRAGSGVIAITKADASGNWTFDLTSTTLPEGQHTFTATATDAAKNVSPVSAPFVVTIDKTAPQVMTNFAYATEHAIILTPSGGDSIASLTFASLGATDQTTGQVYPAHVDGTGTARFDAGRLPDGTYALTGTLTDLAGNATPIRYDFFVLTGDADHDGTVGPSDFNLLASHFGQTGQTFATGDFDYDGTVGPGDFNLYASQFDKTAAAPPPPPTTPTTTLVAVESRGASSAVVAPTQNELLAAPAARPTRRVARQARGVR